MNYLVVLHATYKDGQPSKKAIYEVATKDEAIALYHSTMATYMRDSEVSTCMVIVTNTVAGVLVTDSYVAEC